MLKNLYLRTALILAIVLAGVVVFSPVDQRLGISLSMVALVGVILAGKWPPVASVILKHPGTTVVLGVAIMALGFVLALAMGYGVKGTDRMTIGLVILVAGTAVMALPRALKAAADARARAATITPSLQPTGSGLDSGLDAFRLLAREKVALATVVGPCFLVFWAPLGALLLLTRHDKAALKSGFDHIGAIAVLVMLLGALVLVLASMAVAAIQWSRYLATQQIPRVFDVPWRALWGFSWRFTVFGAILRVPDQFGPWLKSHAPDLAPWATSGLTSLVGLAFLVLFSPWGMVLPAIALGGSDRTSTRARQTALSDGRSYYLGSLMVLAPLAVIGWLLGLVPSNPHKEDAPGLIMLVVWTLALFLTIAATMTFLTEIYLRRQRREMAVA